MKSSTISPETGPQAHPDALRGLFHQLGNQLGVILANAELMELKLVDPVQRARASHVIHAALEAMAATRSLREQSGI
ncbi:MAG: hypothetical protein AB7I13_08540 [Vicinamibacterales bacterium]